MVAIEPVEFIRAHLPIEPVPGIAGLRLHHAAPHSGVGRLVGGGGAPPYWAYRWAGGLALARFVLDRPEAVAGCRVLDLGAGSGLVGIAAAKAGAVTVIAADVDPNAMAAMALNAALNGVTITPMLGDPTGEEPAPVEVVLVGDLFYAGSLARRVTAYLDHCLAAGQTVIVGDPWRAHLPKSRLTPLAEYDVAETGERRVRSAVFAFGRA